MNGVYRTNVKRLSCLSDGDEGMKEHACLNIMLFIFAGRPLPTSTLQLRLSCESRLLKVLHFVVLH